MNTTIGSSAAFGGGPPDFDVPPIDIPPSEPRGDLVVAGTPDVPPEPDPNALDPWLLFGVALFGMATLMIVLRRRRRSVDPG